MTNSSISKKYDLEERTAKFGEAVIELCKKTPKNEITRPIIQQLIRAAVSVGSNYCEADDAVSKKDFRNKIGTCKKEAREPNKHRLRMLSKAAAEFSVEIEDNLQEAKELHLIFNSIFRKLDIPK